jgi:hypothetical protein
MYKSNKIKDILYYWQAILRHQREKIKIKNKKLIIDLIKCFLKYKE